MPDLVLLVADKNMQYALQGALARPEALGIRPIDYEFRSHPGRDGGIRASGSKVLAAERHRFAHALMLLDFEGSGTSLVDPISLEQDLDREIRAVWNEDAKAIVIAPEVDVWLWGSDNALRDVFQWPLQDPVRDFLRAKGFEFLPDGKPLRPKEALEAMVPVHRQPRSSALYEKVTSRISLQNCRDPAFLRLNQQLQVWFPNPALAICNFDEPSS